MFLKQLAISDVSAAVLQKAGIPKEDITGVYECRPGLFGPIPDILLTFEEIFIKEEGEFRCYGYVYNGTDPKFSEPGAFGFDAHKTQRVW